MFTYVLLSVSIANLDVRYLIRNRQCHRQKKKKIVLVSITIIYVLLERVYE